MRYIAEIKAAALANNIIPEVLGACVLNESNGDLYAARFEPGWKYQTAIIANAKRCGTSQATEKNLQAISWGLCQIMGTVAREAGFKGPLPMLCEVSTNLTMAAAIWSTNIKKFGSLEAAAAAFNGGAGAAKKGKNGKYSNQAYVDKFSKNLIVAKAALA